LSPERVFDKPHYVDLDQAKLALFQEFLPVWRDQLALKTAWDIACGVGRYSALLMELGILPRAIDGRLENVEESARRVPGLTVTVGDVEDPALAQMERADLVLCLGLLYHLENPFRAIYNVAQITGKIVIIESMCTWDELPVMYLREEGPTEDQGLRHIAFYPSESCLAKMLYRSGFSHVYRFIRLPDNVDFKSSADQTKRRTMLVATRAEFSSPYLEYVPQHRAYYDPWKTTWARSTEPFRRVGHFVTKPWPEKVATMRRIFGS